MNIPLQFFVWTYILILSTHLEVELLDHMVSLYLTSWRTAKLFYKVSAPFYVPTENISGFQLFHLLVNACYGPSVLSEPPQRMWSSTLLRFWCAFPWWLKCLNVLIQHLILSSSPSGNLLALSSHNFEVLLRLIYYFYIINIIELFPEVCPFFMSLLSITFPDSLIIFYFFYPFHFVICALAHLFG